MQPLANSNPFLLSYCKMRQKNVEKTTRHIQLRLVQPHICSNTITLILIKFTQVNWIGCSLGLEPNKREPYLVNSTETIHIRPYIQGDFSQNYILELNYLNTLLILHLEIKLWLNFTIPKETQEEELTYLCIGVFMDPVGMGWGIYRLDPTSKLDGTSLARATSDCAKSGPPYNDKLDLINHKG